MIYSITSYIFPGSGTLFYLKLRTVTYWLYIDLSITATIKQCKMCCFLPIIYSSSTVRLQTMKGNTIFYFQMIIYWAFFAFKTYNSFSRVKQKQIHTFMGWFSLILALVCKIILICIFMYTFLLPLSKSFDLQIKVSNKKNVTMHIINGSSSSTCVQHVYSTPFIVSLCMKCAYFMWLLFSAHLWSLKGIIEFPKSFFLIFTFLFCKSLHVLINKTWFGYLNNNCLHFSKQEVCCDVAVMSPFKEHFCCCYFKTQRVSYCTHNDIFWNDSMF